MEAPQGSQVDILSVVLNIGQLIIGHIFQVKAEKRALKDAWAQAEAEIKSKALKEELLRQEELGVWLQKQWVIHQARMREVTRPTVVIPPAPKSEFETLAPVIGVALLAGMF